MVLKVKDWKHMNQWMETVLPTREVKSTSSYCTDTYCFGYIVKLTRKREKEANTIRQKSGSSKAGVETALYCTNRKKHKKQQQQRGRITPSPMVSMAPRAKVVGLGKEPTAIWSPESPSVWTYPCQHSYVTIRGNRGEKPPSRNTHWVFTRTLQSSHFKVLDVLPIMWLWAGRKWNNAGKTHINDWTLRLMECCLWYWISSILTLLQQPCFQWDWLAVV